MDRRRGVLPGPARAGLTASDGGADLSPLSALPVAATASVPAAAAASPLPSPSPSSDALKTADSVAHAASDWVATSLRILLIVVLAVVLRFVLHRLITRIVRRAVLSPTVPEALRQRFTDVSPTVSAERRRQRAETVGSVLKSMSSILVFGVAFATVLSELGIDLGPVLASAGIIGVALGFGAQNLVKDFLNGIFMILEDQYGVGDAIDIGPASGIVESVGLRTTRLRSVDGTVWHVRNGEVTRVGNQSQGWSRALLDVPVAYSSDLDHAQEVIKAVADDVCSDDAFDELVLAEPEVWGVEQLGDDGVLIRLVVKTAPLEQWKVARELRKRIKERFDDEGIEIPFPQRSLWLRTQPVETEQLTAEPRPKTSSGSRPPSGGEADVAREDTGVVRRADAGGRATGDAAASRPEDDPR